jgi:hypothetical protein
LEGKERERWGENKREKDEGGARIYGAKRKSNVRE